MLCVRRHLFEHVGNVSARYRSPCPHDAPVRSYRPSHGGYAGQVAGEHASAASQLSTGGRRRTDRAKSFQADDEGSIPFTRSIFKIKDLSEIMRELNAPENC